MNNDYLIQEVNRSITNELGRIINGQTDEDERYSINLSEIAQQFSPIFIGLFTGFLSSVWATRYIHAINQVKRANNIELNRDDAIRILDRSIEVFESVKKEIANYDTIVINKEELIKVFEKQYDEYNK